MKNGTSIILNTRLVTGKSQLHSLVKKGFLISTLAFGTMLFTAQSTLAVEVKTKISSEINQKNTRHVTFKILQLL